MRQLRVAVLASPVEILMGLVMIGGGLALNGAPEWYPILGNVIAVFGGILASWGVTKTYTAESATEGLSEHLRMVQQRLGTVSSQISEVARDIRADHCTAEMGAALIMQSTGTLNVVISDLEQLTGQPLAPEVLISTLDRVLELRDLGTRMLELAPTPQPELADVQPELADVQPELGHILQELESFKFELQTQIGGVRAQQRAYKEEAVRCVSCGGEVKLRIGTLHGDSAAPVCESCGTRFHAHRGRDGNVFTRRVGSGPLPSRTIACPNCSNTIPVRITEGTSQPQIRPCFGCGTEITIDPDTGNIISHERLEILVGTVVRAEPRPAVLRCPSCQDEVNAYVHRDDRLFAHCSVCKRVVSSAPAVSPGRLAGAPTDSAD